MGLRLSMAGPGLLRCKGPVMDEKNAFGGVDGLAARSAFAELSKIMLGDQPLGAALQRVAELAQRTIPEVDQVSVTLMRGGRPETVVFTGGLAVSLDERQYESGFGPCLDAAVTGQTIVVANDDPDSRYADFSRAAWKAGVTHTVSVGLPVPQRVIGGLNLYASTAEPIEESTVDLAEAFAGYAAVAVANAALYSSTADQVRQLQQAVKSRTVIDQAKGILMGRGYYPADAAFEELVKTSQRENRKLRDVAQTIVDGVGTDELTVR